MGLLQRFEMLRSSGGNDTSLAGYITVPDNVLWSAGLQPNEAYMFAVAAFDVDHKLISELGLSAGPIAALLPLPLYQCWCHLALTAARLGASNLCHQAAATVLSHFISTSPDCPVWEANPLDSQQLNRSATLCLCDRHCQLCSYTKYCIDKR